jgi:hypothetical protein
MLYGVDVYSIPGEFYVNYISETKFSATEVQKAIQTRASLPPEIMCENYDADSVYKFNGNFTPTVIEIEVCVRDWEGAWFYCVDQNEGEHLVFKTLNIGFLDKRFTVSKIELDKYCPEGVINM